MPDPLQSRHLQDICLIATDMDGTLTQNSKFTAQLFHALEVLVTAQFPVLMITGRSAGWVSGLKHYLPIQGAIAENGGLFFPPQIEAPQPLVNLPSWTQHRQNLAAMFEQLQQQFPQLQESADNQFRLTDWTFDVTGLNAEDLQQLQQLCEQSGWGFTYSTVQCHIKLKQQDKATGLKQVLQQYYPQVTAKQVLTIGDSPNDESLFNPVDFPVSVGVANVLDYQQQLTYQPAYVTNLAEGKGFCELVELLRSRLENNGK
ncbi:MAG: HAD family hydrolase [Spirulinaceae cyanobacterium]